MPVGTVEGNASAGEERAPGHTGQVVNACLSVALVGHVDRGAFMICTKIAQRSFGISRAAGTTRDQHRIVAFEGSDSLRGQVYEDAFLGFGNFGGKGSKLIVRDDAHVM